MKKIIIAASALAIASSCLCMNTFAEEENSCKAYVTVTLNPTTIAEAQKEVTVTDIDSDGKLTINDALYIFHEENFEGGAEAGYKSSVGQYGLMLDKLYGIENGGNFGYYVNNNFAMGLADEISDGAYITAFVYTNGYADTYSWFDKNSFDAEQGEQVELTLNHIVFGADGAPSAEPVSGATITFNGVETVFKTDENGKVTIAIENTGLNEISAVSDTLTLVPPVCLATIAGDGTTSTTSTTTTTTTTTSTETTTTTNEAAPAPQSSTSSVSSSTANGGETSPNTGVAGAGLTVAVLAVSVGVAFAARKRNED